jgi:predicted glycoside hydrolase/deacetylase ChbG (UPF0249 family)
MSVPSVHAPISIRPAGGRVVLHADDLGLNSAIDDGILDSFRHGVLTSTSVLANGPSAEQALIQVRRLSTAWCEDRLTESQHRLALDDPRLPFDLGVHLNLTQGRPLTAERYPSELLDDEGRFPGVGPLFAALLRSRRKWQAALRAELAAQIAWVADHGLRPTHVNGHQYVELFPGVGALLPELLAHFSIRVVRLPVERRLWATTLFCGGTSTWALAHVKRLFALQFERQIKTANLSHADEFFGTAHAGRITLRALSRRFSAPLDERLIEIGMHPGIVPNRMPAAHLADGWHDPLAARRPAERELLCSAGLTEMLANRRLRLGRLSVVETPTWN